ncbi:MAG: NAD(P)H-dependent oxidoreductase [Methanomassiliicoccaceae archaeon]|jgi:multimeric flavodoxin WrbA|nr:NAD(P)H-dependent oxidoreductase [Methanomassiliicoccaceae archaeon]
MKIAIFNGSSIKNDAVSKLTSSISEKLRADGSDVKEYFLYQMNIKGCIDCGPRRPDDELKELIDEFTSNDMTIFATPVYRWNISGALGTFLEELSAYCRFDDKMAKATENRKLSLVMAIDSEENVADDAAASIQNSCSRLKIKYAGSFVLPFNDRSRISDPEYQGKISEFVKKIMS